MAEHGTTRSAMMCFAPTPTPEARERSGRENEAVVHGCWPFVHRDELWLGIDNYV